MMLLHGIFTIVVLILDLCLSKIVTRPSNAEAAAGDRVTLKCTIDNTDGRFAIEWQHVPVDSTSPNFINRDRFIIGSYATRFSIEGDTTIGQYNLVIDNVTVADAGRYTCIDIMDGSKAEAQLIVFDSFPSPQFCKTDAPKDGSVGLNSCGLPADAVQLSCRMSFRGLLRPTLDWEMTYDGQKNLTVVDNYTLTSITVKADRIGDQNFTCFVKYPEWGATSKFRWTTMIHVFSNRTKVIEVSELEAKQRTVDCGFTTEHQCIYSWSSSGGKTVSSAAVLQAKDLKSGVYTCTAKCTVRGTQCTVHPVEVHLMQSDEGGIMVATVVAVVVLVIAVVVVIIVVVYSRRRQRTRTSKGKIQKGEDDYPPKGEVEARLMNEAERTRSADTVPSLESNGEIDAVSGLKPDLLEGVLNGSKKDKTLTEVSDDEKTEEPENVEPQNETPFASKTNSSAGSELDLSSFIVVKVNEDGIKEETEYRFPK